MNDSLEIQELFEADASDRAQNTYTTEKDESRAQSVVGLLAQGNILTSNDYYRAAMILHHRGSVNYLKEASKLAKKSIELGNDKAKWLFAAITDRICMETGVPQKYGTQFFRPNENAPWELYDYDKSTTDEERRQFNVPPIVEQKEAVEKMNSESKS